MGVAAVVLLGAAAMLIGRALIAPAPPAPPAPAPVAPPAGAQDNSVALGGAAGGLSISYPSGWRRVAASDPEVQLLAEGDGSSMLVRTADLGVEVGPGDLDAARTLTEDLVRAATQVRLLRPPARVTLGGLSGYLYLYTFSDAATGERGAHAHYFLFRGQTLITMVFQTVPAEGFAANAPLFDQIGETLRATPG